LLQRPDFNALAFAIRTAALAGLPASVVATLISVDTLTSADAAGAGTSSAMQMIAVVYDAVRPFEISAVLVFLSWLGSWSLTGGRGSLQAVRRLYLTVDAAVSFWPLMVVALAAALGFPSGANDDWLSSLASDLTRASGADQSLSPDDVDLLRTLIVNLVRGSVAAGVWLTPLWLLAIKLLRTPRIVTELAGEDIAGGEAAAVARHAVVFSLVAGLAAAAVISVLMLLGIRLG
jgi:hypothetical protein